MVPPFLCRPPSVTSILSLFLFFSFGLPSPHDNHPCARGRIPPFVCFGIYRALRFSPTNKNEVGSVPAEIVPGFRLRASTRACSNESRHSVVCESINRNIRNVIYSCRGYRDLQGRLHGGIEGGTSRKSIQMRP